MTISNANRRPRRLRRTAAIRHLVAENTLSVDDLLCPVFVTETGAKSGPEPIGSLPGQYRYSLADLGARARSLQDLGIRGMMLFPVNDPARKDARGSYALDSKGLAARAIDTVKNAAPDLLVFADVALDPYTDHGHDGIINHTGYVLNDETVDALVAQSLVLARSGSDFVCPSDMMDGRIGAIRNALDREGFIDVGILSYAAKYASAFYGPFRDAVGQKIRGLDKSTYQLPPASRRQALIEADLDINEGADILMVKPGGPYLDILRDLRNHVELPLAVYQVSGEYAMIKAAAQNGWLDERSIVLESMMSFKRAGADIIASYFAEDIARYLKS